MTSRNVLSLRSVAITPSSRTMSCTKIQAEGRRSGMAIKRTHPGSGDTGCERVRIKKPVHAPQLIKRTLVSGGVLLVQNPPGHQVTQTGITGTKMKLVCVCLLLAATATSAFRPSGSFGGEERQSELYDPTTQKCCRGVAYRKTGSSYTFCCGNSTYDITEEMCCQGVPLPLSAGTRTACCGGMTYDLKASLCCMGRVAQLPKGTPVEDLEHFECREMKAVDTRNVSENELEPAQRTSKKMMPGYGGGYYPPPPPPPSNRCNGKTFNRTTHMCCNNTLKESSIPHAACCGDDQAYDNDKQICCRSPEGNWQLSDKPPVSSYSPYLEYMDPSCCGGIGYDMTTQLCCNQTVYKIPEGGQRWAYQCCGTDAIDTTTHTCCDRKNAQEKKTELEGCCGNETYSYKDQLCCYHKTNTKVFDKPDGRSQCCGGEVISTRTQLCCYDYANTDGIFENVFEKTTPSTQCCGNSTYDSTKEVCCGSSAIPIQSGSKRMRCCGDRDYNSDTHICCDQKVMEVTDPSKRSCCSFYSSDDYTYTRSCYGMNRPNTYPNYPQIYYGTAQGEASNNTEEETTETAEDSETTDATEAVTAA